MISMRLIMVSSTIVFIFNTSTCFKIFSLVMICDHLTSYASYLLVVFSYLCSKVFIWCCCCFTSLKNWKKWVFLYFFEVLRHFSTYFDIFSRCRREVTFWTLADTFPDTTYTALGDTYLPIFMLGDCVWWWWIILLNHSGDAWLLQWFVWCLILMHSFALHGYTWCLDDDVMICYGVAYGSVLLEDLISNKSWWKPLYSPSTQMW
jgi:hypothetical protein